jgi:hypothetical protein
MISRPIGAAVAVMLLLPACATQRYGRQTGLSNLEASELTCREIRVERSKSEQFLYSVRKQRAGLNGAQVLAIINDFGIGNAMEGNDAEASGEMRLQQLDQLALQRNCGSATALVMPPAHAAASDGTAAKRDDHMQAHGALVTATPSPGEGPMLLSPVIAVKPVAFQPVASTGNIAAVRREFLVRAVDITPSMQQTLNLRSPRGVMVMDVIPGGEGSRAGLAPGDAILVFNGTPIGGVDDMQRELSRVGQNSIVVASIWRNGREMEMRFRF